MNSIVSPVNSVSRRDVYRILSHLLSKEEDSSVDESGPLRDAYARIEPGTSVRMKEGKGRGYRGYPDVVGTGGYGHDTYV